MRSLLLLCAASAATAAAPSGLLVDFKRSPSLGVRNMPYFTWIVPPCMAATSSAGHDGHQTAYQVVVSEQSAPTKKVWDSGKMTSNESTYVAYSGPALLNGTRYSWSVTTWTSSGGGTACASEVSAPAVFVTSLGESVAWDKSANFVSHPSKPTFAYFRKSMAVDGAVSALAFITTTNKDPMLSAYKFYIDGALVNLGPGRGEAPVWGGDGVFRSLPYYTLDISSFIVGKTSVVLALECMMQGGPQALLQITLAKASGARSMVGTDATWSAFNGDVHRNPGKSTHGGSAGTGFIEYIDARNEPVGWKTGPEPSGAGWAPATATPPSAQQITQLHPKMQPPMEVEPPLAVKTIRPIASPPPPPPPPSPPGPPAPCVIADENKKAAIGCPKGEVIGSVDFASFGTPAGSCAKGFTHSSTCDSKHSLAVVSGLCVGKQTCEVPATCTEFKEKLMNPDAFCWDTKKQLAVKVTCKKASAAALAPAVGTTYLADFGKELTGGMVLNVKKGVAGESVVVTCGESISGDTVGATWGWIQTWTLRDGEQTLEQHKYMECRFVTLAFSGAIAQEDFTLSAWKTHYPWYDEDSHFSSSNATLDAVFELSRYTVDAASLDTYTDSNTRERRPYEADGIIAASARLLVQRDILWGRHSHAWVINDPTWPVEWKQITPFLLWQDYMATGTNDLAIAFQAQAYDRTMIKFLDSTGLLDTSKMGRHIVDWMPDGHETDETVGRGEYSASKHTSVSNGFAAQGLELLSHMLQGVPGDKLRYPWANASAIGATGAALKAQMVKQMWNGTAFCDGPCTEVKGASKLMSSMFTLSFGMVPEANVASNWQTVADWGIEGIGDYGAFWFMNAVAGGYYADASAQGATLFGQDDGTAIYHSLVKCDEDSWCSGLRDDNLTMTRESWHDGTYSHEWGTAAIPGVVWGIMGMHQTSPTWQTFIMMPKLGGLTHATITVPTMRGYINATATPSSLEVHVPCNSAAKLCLPRSQQDTKTRLDASMPTYTSLLLDGSDVDSVVEGGHLCASAPVGCGAGGASRVLRAH